MMCGVNPEAGLSYAPSETEQYQHFVSAYRKVSDDTLDTVPIYSNMNGYYLIRDFQCSPYCRMEDADSDGTAELFCGMDKASADMAWRRYYRLTGEGPVLAEIPVT